MGVHRHLLYACACVCDVRAILYHMPNSNPNCELRVSKIKTKLKLKLKPRLMCHVLRALRNASEVRRAICISRVECKPAGAAGGWVRLGEGHAQTSRALHLHSAMSPMLP